MAMRHDPVRSYRDSMRMQGIMEYVEEDYVEELGQRKSKSD
jgi:hypothetical protein